jgi:hypothetical protein
MLLFFCFSGGVGPSISEPRVPGSAGRGPGPRQGQAQREGSTGIGQ